MEANRLILRRLIERIDFDELVDEVLDGIQDLPEYRSFVGEDDAQQDRGRIGVQWNLEIFLRWAVHGGEVTEDERNRMRELIGARASEGRPLRDGLVVYRKAIRAGWNAVLERADERERLALGSAFEIPLEWLDLVTDEYEASYAAERAANISNHERRARWLIDLIVQDLQEGDGRRLAEALGFRLADRYRPFLAMVPGGAGAKHLALAAQLREMGDLARSEGLLVTGLSHGVPDLGPLPGSTVLCLGGWSRPDEVGEAFGDLRLLGELAAAEGMAGLVEPGRFAVPMMLLRSPAQAAQLRERIFGPLLAAGREDLAETLSELARSGFDRAGTARRLNVHRNTLSQRESRIGQITGLDLGDPEARGEAWLATRARDVQVAQDSA